jgi:spermidine synthase
VPTFGEWGFVLAGGDGLAAYQPPTHLPDGLRYLTSNELPSMFEFPRDMQKVPAEANRLNNQVLVRYYEQEFDKINR